MERGGSAVTPIVRRPLWLRAAVVVLLVVLAAVLPLSAVRSINEARYGGAALVNDQGEGTFLRAYADWTRVEAGPRGMPASRSAGNSSGRRCTTSVPQLVS